MHIERIRHIDASEPDESGIYEYYYEYDLYRFTAGAECFVARSYTNEPDEAHFLRIETDGQPRTIVDGDLIHPLLIAAQDYLHAEGKAQLSWLSGRGNGYEPLLSTKA